MKAINVFVILIFFSLYSYSQEVYWGYYSCVEPSDGDIVIVEPLPWSANGFFDTTVVSYLDDMKSFMIRNDAFRFEVFVYNDDIGDSIMVRRLTEVQCNALKTLFEKDKFFYKKIDFVIVAKGFDETFDSLECVGKDHPYYNFFRSFNRRVEIKMNLKKIE